MNREIKFRFFDKNGKKMYQAGVLDFDDKKVYMAGYMGYSQSNFLLENVELMQYTGLKDKNGVEIYESDVLEIDEEGRRLFGTKDKLFWKYLVAVESNGCFMGTPAVMYNDSLQSEFGYLRLLYLWVVQRYSSVVGNIYDNPELLEKEGK